MFHKQLSKYLRQIFACVCVIALLVLPFGNVLTYAASKTEYSYIFDEQSYLFGNQLEEEAQYFYLKFLENLKEPTEKEVALSLEGKNISSLSGSINDALGALFQDFPEYQWLKLGNGSKSSSYQATYINGVMSKLVFFPAISSEYTSVSAIVKEQQKVEETVEKLFSSMPSTYTTRYERIKYIHDYLVKTVTYDTSQKNSKIHSAAGALLNQLSVCEGYAKAFKLACEKIGVPCQLVVSRSHMWNQVQMENGEWYLVDVTFDDPIMNGTSNYKDGKNLTYNYFLKGSRSMEGSTDHITSGNIIIGGTDFSYETLAVKDYDKSKAKEEKLIIFSDNFKERFIESLYTPVFLANKKTLYVNQSYTQKMTKVSDEAKISYSSSNRKVATINKNGTIKGIGAGSCTITTTVKQNGETYVHKLKLTIKEPTLTFIKSTTEISLGSLFQFEAKKTGIAEDIKWSVDDTSVAIIYKGGTLKPLKEGNVVVTAKAGKKSIQITVKITK